jgi:ribosomal protein L27
MTPEPNQGKSMSQNDNKVDDSELERLGIRRVEREVYQRGEYIYSNLRDALAAANREMKS